MKVFLITIECADPYFGPEIEGHCFSTNDKAQEYINGLGERYDDPKIMEIELDAIH